MMSFAKIACGLTFSVLIASASVTNAACTPTTFQPINRFIPHGTTHNAYSLTDPAGQQTAIFDIQWGGALASLKYNGTEMVWGNATGGMVQPAMHSFPNSIDYNPTQSGDNTTLGSTVSGVKCIDSNHISIISGPLLDFNLGRSGYLYTNAVKNNAAVSGSYATPYTVVTTATFVVNPGGTPGYYLQLKHNITNIDSSENFSWGFELAGYVPYSFSHFVSFPVGCTSTTPCSNPSTPQLVAGLYPTTGLAGGTAFYVSPAIYWGNKTSSAGFATDTINQNQSTHLLTGNWLLSPGTSRAVVWYVMAGDWNTALNFAQTH